MVIANAVSDALSPFKVEFNSTPVKPEHHGTLPAITHVDGSARVQTVYPEQSPLYYGLIERFITALDGRPSGCCIWPTHRSMFASISCHDGPAIA